MDGDTDTEFSYPRSIATSAIARRAFPTGSRARFRGRAGAAAIRPSVVRELVSGNYFSVCRRRRFSGAYSCLRTINKPAPIRWP